MVSSVETLSASILYTNRSSSAMNKNGMVYGPAPATVYEMRAREDWTVMSFSGKNWHLGLLHRGFDLGNFSGERRMFRVGHDLLLG